MLIATLVRDDVIDDDTRDALDVSDRFSLPLSVS